MVVAKMDSGRARLACAAVGAGSVLALAACSSAATTSKAAKSVPPAVSGIPLASIPPPSGTGDAAALQNAYVSVVQHVLPSVVQIETDAGLGSGIVLDARGDIVTNAHVVDSATTFTVTTSSGHKYSGTLVGTYAPDDLAVIHVSGAQLTPAVFADSSKLQVGDIVMAIGNPLGLQSSVTAGIVSAVGRTVSEDNGVVLPDTIQTSAEINPGNSGGALVDLAAQVIGIPTLAATDPQLGGGAAPGIGFAIPSSIVSNIAGQLVTQGHVTQSGRAYLGVTLADSFGGGAVISSVVSDGPAGQAGLQPGDTITAIGGTTTPTSEAVTEALAARAPGDKVQVSVTAQDGTQRTVTVTLGQLPG